MFLVFKSADLSHILEINFNYKNTRSKKFNECATYLIIKFGLIEIL